jgi:hypothetical protein
MIVQLYPNVEVFEFEHGDEHCLWVNATNEQIEVLSSMDWLICSINIKEDYDILDFDISELDISAAFSIADLFHEY